MANTYTAQNAVDMVRKFIKDVPLSGSSVDIMLCDRVNRQIWTSWPWKWSVTNMTAISLVDGTQDYSMTAGNQTTFYRLLRARIVRTDSTPDEWRELSIAEFLAPELTLKGGINTIRTIAVQPNNQLRLERAASVPTGNTLEIQGEFQAAATKITALSATFLFPDEYFDTFVEGLLWKAYQFTDDNRCGTVQATRDGRTVYTGQLGVFMNSLQTMQIAEDYSGFPLIFPQDSLGAADGGVSIYGAF